MNYFYDIITYISKKLWDKFHIKTGIVSDDRRNVQFITDNRKSESINIYRITSLSDLDACVDLIDTQLIKSV